MTAALRIDEAPDADTYCAVCKRVVEDDGSCPLCEEMGRIAVRDELAEQHLGAFGWDTEKWSAKRDDRHAWFLHAMKEEGLPAIAGDWDAFDSTCWSIAAERAREIARDWRTPDEERAHAIDVLAGMGIDLDPSPALGPESVEEWKEDPWPF